MRSRTNALHRGAAWSQHRRQAAMILLLLTFFTSALSVPGGRSGPQHDLRLSRGCRFG
jgi:hypothetical protein